MTRAVSTAPIALLRRSLACAVLLLTPRLGAQGLSRYVPPLAASDLAVTERAMVTPHLHLGALAGAEYLHSTAGTPPSEHRVAAFVSASFGLFDRLQLGLSAASVVTQSSQSLASSGLSDLRVDVRVRLAGPPRLSGVRVAVAGSLSLPTGSTAAGAGDGGVGASPRLLLEWQRPGSFLLALNLGASLHPSRTFVTPTLGSELFVRAGLTLPASRRFWFTVEAFGSTALASLTASDTLALETLFGVHWWASNGFTLALTAGPRVLAGVGAADVRAVLFAGYAYDAPEAIDGPGDRDADAVLDADDLCPDEPAGRRPDPQRRGCPTRDRDGDSVPDARDLCPDEHEGAEPDPRRLGCPFDDRDMDGVRDREDLCPTEPVGDFGDPDHRGCPLRDGDRDRVPDAVDVCPDQPAGEHPDGARRGCPDPDIDHDRVLNERDACPLDPGAPSPDPRANGCPRVRVTADAIVISQQPRFAIDRDLILPQSFSLLEEVQRALEAHPEITAVEVQGHTDNRGADPHNSDLSQRRADSIVRWLVQHGISPTRLTPRGYGASRPIVDNATPQGRAMNRRVEFLIRTRAPVSPTD